jgi:hypothetical protein
LKVPVLFQVVVCQHFRIWPELKIYWWFYSFPRLFLADSISG